jgi:hypothetical protein
MQPHFLKHDLEMFYKYLKTATHYFEFGSGGSTIQASLQPTIQSIYSVESDVEYYKKLNTLLSSKETIHLLCFDLHAKPNTWGFPGPTSNQADWIRYSSSFNSLETSVLSKIDLILIDGRFRVACALKCFEALSDTCIILFDDFLNRSIYKIVLDYYTIIEQTSDATMVCLKKKLNCEKPSEELIRKYELIPE